MKTFKKIIILVFFFAVSACLIAAGSQAEEKLINVLQSRSIRPYENAFSGFKESMNALEYDVRYNIINMQEKTPAEIIEKIEEMPGDMVLAIGTEAALFAKNNLKGAAIVFMMVLDPRESGIAGPLTAPAARITGISLDIPIEEQLRVFRKAVPGIKKVGMLYDKKNKSVLAREASEAAAKVGLKMILKPVFSQDEISMKLEEVYRECDCLWAGVDPFIYNPATAGNIILFTLKNKIPFMAFSSNFVRAGALMSLECDYKDIGRQAAEVVSDILKGRKPSSIPVQAPRKTYPVINLRTARTLNVYISDDLREEALIFGD
jgi:putative ABC transport system substrate-binding protein